ncbi:MAG: c-type cytochrome [Gammaproteobacteria bacterium]|nr:c-type cytochrome [Gammaproteobacteria bacterium]
MVGGARALALTRRGRGAALSALAASLGWAALTGAGAQTFDLTDYSGEELFQQFCSACHGDHGRGDGPVAATLNVFVPDLTRLAERRDGLFPAGEVREIIDGRALITAHGTRAMPVWGYEFWIEEGADAPAEADARELIDRLVRHVESLQQVRDPARPVD